MKGTIFSIEEFAVHDGAGIRTTIFFKGCPLCCRWCHNPEGLIATPKIVKNPNGCLNCAICKEICISPQQCILCKKCVMRCPQGLIHISGEEWDAKELAEKILKSSNILTESGGGVTFSGGEVLMQSEFLCELADLLSPLHKTIETSGYGDSRSFLKVLQKVDFVYYDLKQMDEKKHIEFTGKSNQLIIKNANILMDFGMPFTVRIPFIHDVNTDEENIIKVCELLKNAKTLVQVEILPYNQLAGAKYAMLGHQYYEFEKATKEEMNRAKFIFENYGISAVIRQ